MPISLFKTIISTLRRLRYPGSLTYWERRYATGGHSGTGSIGRLAAYKAETVNHFVRDYNIQSVIEFGCGDGQQLRLADYPAYTGLDISETAVARCRALFAHNASKKFEVYKPENFNLAGFQADMALSMEVVFHLTEDETYRFYLRHLFASARRWVVVFSTNEADTTGGIFPHFRPRHFTPDVPPGWVLRQHIPNPHRDISLSDFFFFEKTA